MHWCRSEIVVDVDKILQVSFVLTDEVTDEVVDDVEVTPLPPRKSLPALATAPFNVIAEITFQLRE